MSEFEDIDTRAASITTLEHARRVITQQQRAIARLRREVAELAESLTCTDNEFYIFLDNEYADLLRQLYEQRQLITDQEEDIELEDALAQFVCDWLDVQHDTVRIANDPLFGDTIAPTA